VSGSAALIRGDALRIPLADNSVDLIVTSPPYFALRSYQDGGEHYDGQIGSEATPQAFIDALLAVTAECVRVLKPSGSMFVNLGDKYSGSGGHNNMSLSGSNSILAGRKHTRRRDEMAAASRDAPDRYNQDRGGIPAKSLMLLPERYRIGAVDQLGLIARAVIVWDKPNGLPESVTDRVRRSHEDWVHLTKQPRYYAAVDEVREATQDRDGRLTWDERKALAGTKAATYSDQNGHGGTAGMTPNPLGKLPGSVWRIASEPLQVHEHVGVDHFAAFPQEWPRRIILGWSPPGYCCECGEARTAVVDKRYEELHQQSRNRSVRQDLYDDGFRADGGMNGRNVSSVGQNIATITGYSCACPTPNAPTRPAVVLDPFCGTGTTVMVARALGRYGIGVDLSSDYLRLARWRIFQSGHAAKTMRRTWDERQGALL
jgi:DNA modification methylase